MAALAGLIFAVSEGAPLASFSLPLGVVAWFAYDRGHARGLPRWIIDFGGIAAAIAALAELFTGDIEARLLSGGHFIVYLTWVFLAQPKTTRSMWWIAALSVLQIAVSSVLTSESWFGAALLVWMLVATWTMAIFTMHRDATLTERSTDDFPQQSPSITNGLRLDERFRFLSGRFLAGVAVLTLSGFFVAMLFYLLIPRVWMSSFRLFDDTSLGATRATGFADQVRLGDIGEIMGSSDVAMELSFRGLPQSREWTAPEVTAWLGDSPLFRGRALETYRSGRWESMKMRMGMVSSIVPRNEPLVQVDFDLRTGGSPTLFTIGHPVACRTPYGLAGVERHTITDEYFRSDDTPTGGFRYSLFIRPDGNDQPTVFELGRKLLQNGIRTSHLTNYDSALLQYPTDLLHVPSLTHQILADLPPNADPIIKARRLESHLRDNPDFQYSLTLAVQDHTIDPLEDFLANRRSGHCEYFASALALMLRAAAIPSRLITGYKGGDWVESKQRFVVQQRHAHAWVEARIHGEWITLDATPPQRDIQINEETLASMSPLAVIRELLAVTWRSGITLNGVQQRELIYTPLAQLAKSGWQRIRDFQGTLKSVVKILKNPQEWFSWRGGLTVFSLLAALTLIVRGLLRLTRRLASWRSNDRRATSEGETVPFFERYREIIGRAGLRRESTQTAQEFGETVVESLQTQLIPAGLEAAPRLLSEEFYRVRFGGQKLSFNDETRLRHTLDHLEVCLAPSATDRH
jgi:hypothetical protein